jgi:hypothetical protein
LSIWMGSGSTGGEDMSPVEEPVSGGGEELRFLLRFE